MKRTISYLLLGVVVSVASAQETLTLNDCQTLALEHNKRIAAAAQQRASAAWMVKSYRGNFFPNVTANGFGYYGTTAGRLAVAGGNLPTCTATGEMDGGFAYFPGASFDYELGTIYRAGIQVEQPIYMGGKVTAAYRMAKVGSNMAQAYERLTAEEVVIATSEAYASVVKARALCVVAQSYQEALTELMRNVESGYREGMLQRNDLLKVQVRLNECALQVRRAENGLRLATMNLCHYVGLPLTTAVEIVGEFPDTALLGEGDLAARAEYAIAEGQVSLAAEEVKLTRSDGLPQVGVVGGYSYTHGLKLNERYLFDGASFSALLNVSIPLYHFGERSGKVRAAKAKLLERQLTQADIIEQLTLERCQAENNLEEARLEVALTAASTAQAAENVRITEQQYIAGTETLSALLEAQLLWQQAQQQQVEARFNCYVCQLRLQKAAGVLPLGKRTE